MSNNENGRILYRDFLKLPENGKQELCVCVNDPWDYVSYCSPVDVWKSAACLKEHCGKDDYCSSYYFAADRKILDDDKANKFLPCLCNVNIDGCYKATTLNALGKVTELLPEIANGPVEFNVIKELYLR